MKYIDVIKEKKIELIIEKNTEIKWENFRKLEVLNNFILIIFENEERDLIEFCRKWHCFIIKNQLEIFKYLDVHLEKLKDLGSIKDVYYGEYNDYIFDSYLNYKNINIEGFFNLNGSINKIRKKDLFNIMMNQEIYRFVTTYNDNKATDNIFIEVDINKLKI